MLYLLIYLVTGVIVIYVAAAVHLIKAELKGYDALKYWDKHGFTCTIDEFPALMIGIAIWPIRLIQFLCEMEYYYSLYDIKWD